MYTYYITFINKNFFIVSKGLLTANKNDLNAIKKYKTVYYSNFMFVPYCTLYNDYS